MNKLPQKTFFDGFYLWFDKENKEEFYSTPLYLYNTDRKIDTNIRKSTLTLEKDSLKVKPSKKDVALKHPASIYFPYCERIGLMLTRFLNTNLTCFETAYNDFFFAYGFELLSEYAYADDLLR